jgi:hypothetical protein
MGDYSNNNRDYNNQGLCLAKIIRILIICTIRADYFCQTGPKPVDSATSRDRELDHIFRNTQLI